MAKKEYVDEPDFIHGLRVVQDGTEIYNALLKKETVMHWESGDSMYPILMDMEYCRIEPLKGEKPIVGDAVFCIVQFQPTDSEPVNVPMVHRCGEIVERDGETYYKIESTNGYVFGWTKHVFGIAHSTNIFQKYGIDREQ